MEGIEEGKKLRRKIEKKERLARNLLLAGKNVSFAAMITRLSIFRVRKIRKELLYQTKKVNAKAT